MHFRNFQLILVGGYCIGWRLDFSSRTLSVFDFKVTKTGAYLGTGAEEKVSGAFLVLKDDMGNADTLVERSAGWYQTTYLQGQIGHNYFLEATVEGTQYKASNYLPRPPGKSVLRLDTHARP